MNKYIIRRAHYEPFYFIKKVSDEYMKGEFKILELPDNIFKDYDDLVIPLAQIQSKLGYLYYHEKKPSFIKLFKIW